MRAAQINSYGDASVVTINTIDRPTLSTGQVLVRVNAASLNPFDTLVRSGALQQSIPLELPITLGGDFAGEVVEVADDVTNVAVGEIVYGSANAVGGGSGALAEFAVTSANQVAIAPSNITAQEAASLPLVGVSALQVLTSHMRLEEGQKLFVNGGSGGIGSIAIQIGKHIGAYVAATATGEGVAIAKTAGADEIIDYKAQDAADILQGYDAVLDTVGGEGIDSLLNILRQGGIAVTMAGSFDEAKAHDAGVTALSQSTRISTKALNQLTKLVEDGAVQPGIGQVFEFNDIQAAFEARDTGTVKGKVVVQIQQLMSM